jgi:hypothetical protein
VKDTPQAPAKGTPEPSALERMKQFTRRLLAVEKSEIQNPKRAKAKRRHG